MKSENGVTDYILGRSDSTECLLDEIRCVVWSHNVMNSNDGIEALKNGGENGAERNLSLDDEDDSCESFGKGECGSYVVRDSTETNIKYLS